jgi:hypothetical protein
MLIDDAHAKHLLRINTAALSDHNPRHPVRALRNSFTKGRCVGPLSYPMFDCESHSYLILNYKRNGRDMILLASQLPCRTTSLTAGSAAAPVTAAAPVAGRAFWSMSRSWVFGAGATPGAGTRISCRSRTGTGSTDWT